MARLFLIGLSVLVLGIVTSCSPQVENATPTASPAENAPPTASPAESAPPTASVSPAEDAPPTVSVSPAELAELQASWVTLRAEVVEALEGYLEGYYNGNEARIRNYLSESCSPGDVEQIVTGSSFFRLVSLDLFDREVEYDVGIEDDLLVINMADDGLITVLFQPKDAVKILADGSPAPQEVLEGAGQARFEFRREGSFLQIVNCSTIAEGVRQWIQTEASP